MLSRWHRLKSRSIFQQTLRHGSTLFRCPWFSVVGQRHWQASYLPPEGHTVVRLGFVVSKKIHKRAVRRNRVRRRLQALFRAWLASQDPNWLRPWCSLIIIARPGIELQAFHTLQKALTQWTPSGSPLPTSRTHS